MNGTNIVMLRMETDGKREKLKKISRQFFNIFRTHVHSITVIQMQWRKFEKLDLKHGNLPGA